MGWHTRAGLREPLVLSVAGGRVSARQRLRSGKRATLEIVPSEADFMRVCCIADRYPSHYEINGLIVHVRATNVTDQASIERSGMAL